MITLVRNDWESDFFQREIWQLDFNDKAIIDSPFPTLPKNLLYTAKTTAIEQAQYLTAQGFKPVERELEFFVDLHRVTVHSSPYLFAQPDNLAEISSFASKAFTHSRFCQPWYSEQENQRFYHQWITNAIHGQFDDCCLMVKDSEQIQGIVTLRLNGKNAKIGLLAVKPDYQRQGIAKKLLNMAIHWAKSQGAECLYISTQGSNQPAIQLYQKIGGEIVKQSEWFYRFS